MANRIQIANRINATVKQSKNRNKRTRGFSRKELGRPMYKYAEKEYWKRAKNVEMQRVSRSKNAFDVGETILLVKMSWPYDQGLSNALETFRQKNPLGAGW